MESAKWEMIEAGGRTVQSFGLNRLLGQIYALLYLSKDPLSLDAVAQQLKVSKASVSIACRQLKAWGAVHPVWQRGDRKDYYTAERDFKAVLNNGVLDSVRKKLESARTQIELSLQMIEAAGATSEEALFMTKQLKAAEKFRSRVHRLLDNPIVRKVI